VLGDAVEVADDRNAQHRRATTRSPADLRAGCSDRPTREGIQRGPDDDSATDSAVPRVPTNTAEPCSVPAASAAECPRSPSEDTSPHERSTYGRTQVTSLISAGNVRRYGL
jgi:hypothetical protein